MQKHRQCQGLRSQWLRSKFFLPIPFHLHNQEPLQPHQVRSTRGLPGLKCWARRLGAQGGIHVQMALPHSPSFPGLCFSGQVFHTEKDLI